MCSHNLCKAVDTAHHWCPNSWLPVSVEFSPLSRDHPTRFLACMLVSVVLLQAVVSLYRLTGLDHSATQIEKSLTGTQNRLATLKFM